MERYCGPVKILNTDTMEALGYAFLWGYTKTLDELTNSRTYKNLIKDEIDFVIAVSDRQGYSICRQAEELEKIYERKERHKSTSAL